MDAGSGRWFLVAVAFLLQLGRVAAMCMLGPGRWFLVAVAFLLQLGRVAAMCTLGPGRWFIGEPSRGKRHTLEFQ